jgi:hypothetical protein
MLRLYQPCLPTRALKAADRPELNSRGQARWLPHHKVNHVVRLQTKQGFDYASRYLLIVDAILRLKVRTIKAAQRRKRP